MQRPSLNERLYQSAPLERANELIALEPLEARPEREVRARAGLRLQAAEPFDGLYRPERLPVEEQLTLEQGAIQLAPRQHAVVSHTR